MSSQSLNHHFQDTEFLKYAFPHPCDVDLGVGGNVHITKESEILNEIFDKIFALQFSRTKCGDAWFYTNALDEGFFALFFNYF